MGRLRAPTCSNRERVIVCSNKSAPVCMRWYLVTGWTWRDTGIMFLQIRTTQSQHHIKYMYVYVRIWLYIIVHTRIIMYKYVYNVYIHVYACLWLYFDVYACIYIYIYTICMHLTHCVTSGRAPMGARFPSSEQRSSAASTPCQSGFSVQPIRARGVCTSHHVSSAQWRCTRRQDAGVGNKSKVQAWQNPLH